MMEKKIRGVEQELAINSTPSLPSSSLVHLVGLAIEELKVRGLVTNVRVEEERLDYLALNGSRVYNDMSHLELSTPSYNTPLEAVIYDKVAELFTYYAVKGLKGYFKEINAYKNNVSNVPKGNGVDPWWAVSYSTHASILMDRSVCNLGVWGWVEEALVPFIVTRPLLTGGGDMVPSLKAGGFKRGVKGVGGDTLSYVISPRAFFIKRISSNDTVDARGLLNQRDDPHADPEKYWRLHDIHFEGLRSPYQIYLRDCLETLVMTAYERGYLKNPPKLADPVNAIKELSGDVEACQWKIELADGNRVDAVSEILEGFYLAGVEEMLRQNEITETDKMGFNLVEATLHGLGERRLEYFLDGLDWVTKKMLIEEYANGDLENSLAICNQFTLIDDSVLKYLGEEVPSEQVYTTFNLEDAMEFARDAIPIVDWPELASQIARSLRNGPEGTRDYLRALVAREFPFLLRSVEWERINFKSMTINLPEPFGFNRAMCGDLEAKTETYATFAQALRKINVDERSFTLSPVDDHEFEDQGRVGGVN